MPRNKPPGHALVVFIQRAVKPCHEFVAQGADTGQALRDAMRRKILLQREMKVRAEGFVAGLLKHAALKQQWLRVGSHGNHGVSNHWGKDRNSLHLCEQRNVTMHPLQPVQLCPELGVRQPRHDHALPRTELAREHTKERREQLRQLWSALCRAAGVFIVRGQQQLQVHGDVGEAPEDVMLLEPSKTVSHELCHIRCAADVARDSEGCRFFASDATVLLNVIVREADCLHVHVVRHVRHGMWPTGDDAKGCLQQGCKHILKLRRHIPDNLVVSVKDPQHASVSGEGCNCCSELWRAREMQALAHNNVKHRVRVATGVARTGEVAKGHQQQQREVREQLALAPTVGDHLTRG